jgi:uncharacterized membrane protein
VLILGILAVAVGAWLVNLPAMLLALAAAAVLVVVLPRFQFLVSPLLGGWLGIVIAGITGCLAWGSGSVVGRIVGGLVTGFLVVPSATVLAVYRWDRARYRRASA